MNMAAKTARQALIRMLENLGKDCFKKFKTQLCDRRAEPRVRRAAVENADEMDVADVLVRTFTETKALEVAMEVLKDIDCNEDALELEKILKSQFTKGGAGQGAKYMVGDKHFVDFHRRALIDRVRTLAPILDELVEKNVISDEVYCDVRAKPTPQEKMRALFDTALTACGLTGKDIFYEILEKKEHYLIKDLKGE